MKMQSKLLTSKTKSLIIVLVLAVVVSVFFNRIYKPQVSELSKLKSKLSSLDNEIIEIESQFPDLDEKNLLLESETAQVETLKNKLSKEENQLPSKENIPELLNVYLRQSSKDIIDFNLVKPVDEHQKNIYDQLNIEIQFNSNYAGLVNYLNRMEKNFQYIQTKGIVVSSEDNPTTDLFAVKIVLSTYLSDEKKKDTIFLSSGSINETELVKISRDPFYSSQRVVANDAQEEIYKLSGIVGLGAHPTAIIDNEVYKVGDSIGDSKIQDITQNEVILEKQGQIRVLSINAE